MTADQVIRWMARRRSRRNIEGMARYGIRSAKAFGLSVTTLRPLARRIGRDHALALALWRTGWHEARVLAALIDDPDRVTPAQMDRWARAFDNWAVCDAACFHLFDRTPHALAQVRKWARAKPEFMRRAAFATLAGAAVHRRDLIDEDLLALLPAVARAAHDPRNFVKKAVNWALRQIGKRSRSLHRPALDLARRLAASGDSAARWVGADAVRELESRAVRVRLATIRL